MNEYDFRTRERYWQEMWTKERTYEPSLNDGDTSTLRQAQGKNTKGHFYNLMMFPYPSAEGLHVGNMYAFTGSDIYGRMKRMQGYDVFEPIGLDGFGIHSENYALKIGAHPMEQAKVSEENFYRQLHEIGNGFAWDEHLETYDPEYYQWTQWLFIQLWKNGLAYRKKQAVNWCPSCKTVLSDEQAEGGKCERCGTAVVKKDLEQWFFRITKYADRLLKNLETLDWSEKVKIAQKNWIGESEGAEITFPLVGVPGQEDGKHTVKVFTTRPDTLFGATFMVISPELAKSWLEVGWQAGDEVKKYIETALANRSKADEQAEKEKTGVFSGIYAINPANQEKIPVWVADYVLAGYGTGAIMAVPAHDERDYEFAKKYALPVVPVIAAPKDFESDIYTGNGALLNSGSFTGTDSETAKWNITEFVKGERKTQYRLRDWLISRQRYWGPPIPMVFCDACAKAGKGEQSDMLGWYAAPEKDLPVTLPNVKDFRPRGTGESPLASVKEFYETKCPGCGGAARRETDVSDTFLDSAWYYLGYLATSDKRQATSNPFSDPLIRRWLPVNMYIGGAEHSVLHLLYVRFIAMVLHDIGLLDFNEPMTRFRAHGLVIKDGAKMSKSKGNVVNPDEYIKKFGADVLRTYLMFLAPFEQGGDFRDAGILGVERFLHRVWRMANSEWQTANSATARALHTAIKKVTEDIETLNYNTAISALMICLNEFERSGAPSREMFGQFIQLLAPFAPHMAEEIWQQLANGEGQMGHGTFRSIHREPWPEYDAKLLESDTFTLVIQVNGRTRDTVEVPTGTTKAQAITFALGSAKIQQYVGEHQPNDDTIIYVPGRLINIVL
jgi:leucyl-tRNA synthetase